MKRSEPEDGVSSRARLLHLAPPRSRRPVLRSTVSLSVAVALVALASLLALGPHRLDNAILRLRAAWASTQPHPEFVPTPDLPDVTPAIAKVVLAAPPAGPPSGATATRTSPTPSPVASRTHVTSALVIPTDEPLPSPTPAPPTPTATTAVHAAAMLKGLRHEWQTWNNCGPATLAMDLSFFGRQETQADTAKVLKPDRDDKNVNPQEMVAYAETVGLTGIVRRAGTVDMLRRFLDNGFPVIVELWLTPKPNDGLGHYRLMIGYDDAARQFTAYDSYIHPGKDLTVSYDQLDDEWRVFNRTYVVVHEPEDTDKVTRLLGTDVDDQAMYSAGLERAEAELKDRPKDAFAWFNAGSNLAGLERYPEAAQAFDQARRVGLPWRMLWYQFGPFLAYLQVGRNQDVLNLAAANLRQAGNLEESHYYRGLALRALGKPDEARLAFETALKDNPNFVPAREALRSGS